MSLPHRTATGPLSTDGHSQRLQDVGLLDYIDVDKRPTLILEKTTADTTAKETPVVHRNHAFETLLANGRESEESLKRWAVGIYTEDELIDPPDFAGRSWTSAKLRNRWIIVSASGVSVAAMQDRVSIRSVTAGGHALAHRLSTATLGTPARPKNYTAQPMTRSYSSDMGHSRSSEASSEAKHTLPKPFDWTQGAVSKLSSYQRFLMAHPWHTTGFGPMETWPANLRQLVVALVSNPDPRWLFWGPDSLMLYNEACIPLVGGRHPENLGAPVHQTWAEAWDDLSPLLTRAMDYGEASEVKQMPLMVERNGFVEETYWDCNYIPVPGEDGYALGIMVEGIESTQQVIFQRKTDTILKVSAATMKAQSMSDMWARALEAMEPNSADIPFTLVYTVNPVDLTHRSHSKNKEIRPSPTCTIEGSFGLTVPCAGIPDHFSLDGDSLEEGISLVAACRKAWLSKEVVVMDKGANTLPESLAVSMKGRGYGDVITRAAAVPISSHSDELGVFALLIIAGNPRRPMVVEHKGVDALRDVLAKSAAIVHLPEKERKDRQKWEELEDSLTQRLRVTTQEVRRHENRFEKMAENAPVGIYTFAPDRRPLFANDECLSLVGMNREEFFHPEQSGYSWQSWIHPEDVARVDLVWDNLFTNLIPFKLEYRTKYVSAKPSDTEEFPNGGYRTLVAQARPEFDEDGVVVSFQGFVIDVTQEKLTQTLIAAQLEKATEAKQQALRFIDMVSHEMRNPLSAILQSADGIISTMDSAGLPMLNENMEISLEDSEIIIDTAQTIILCAQHQKRIVDDILTLSKLDSNLLEIAPDKVQAPMLLEKALKMYESEIQQADIRAKLRVEPTYVDLGIDFVMIDGSRVLQVVINLLGNAIKFTRDSSIRKITITLGASIERPTGGHHHVSFVPPKRASSVQDLPAAWGNGQEVYLQIAVKDTGSGLTSDEMKSLFHRFSQASPKTYKQYGGSGLGLFISRELTELQGGQIGVASEHGKGSIFTFYLKARRWIPDSSGRRRSEINHLPGTTTSNLLAKPAVPVRRRSAIADKPMILIKPNQTSNSSAQKHVRTVNGKPDPEALSILIVEDNLINQKVMAKQIRALGHVVHVANHGGEALEFLPLTQFWASSDQSTPTPKTPTETTQLDLVFMDLEMPVMGGLACVRKIRELEKDDLIRGHVPVIAVTANARSEQISIALEAGMDEVVTKPFRIPEVVARARTLVGRV